MLGKSTRSTVTPASSSPPPVDRSEVRRRRFFLALLAMWFALPVAAIAQQATTRIHALADRYVDEVRRKFPIVYAGAGLPAPARDRLDINSPADLHEWWAFIDKLQKEADSIRTEPVAGNGDWITLAILKQALSQDKARQTCRLDLWDVKAVSWPFIFGQIAELQPLGDEARRAAMVARFEQVPRFVGQEIENLREGVRSGVTASRTAVNVVIKQLDALLAEPLSSTVYFSPAERDPDEAFRRAWLDVLETSVRPALQGYRDFLRTEYLPKARITASIRANKNGDVCYRALLKANTSIDIAPEDLYARAIARVEVERDTALRAAQRRYGREFSDLAGVTEALRSDPDNKFRSAKDVGEFIAATMKRAKAFSAQVVPHPPTADVELKAHPEAVAATAPAGQYVPADAEGTRAAIYYYRADHVNLTPARLEATVLHEVWPGHHLHALVSHANAARSHGALSQLVYVPGLGEGWATYVESLARELQLYGSDLGIIGSVMDSLTPSIVADIGMHAFG